MENITTISAFELVDKIKKGKISSVEVSTNIPLIWFIFLIQPSITLSSYP